MNCMFFIVISLSPFSTCGIGHCNADTCRAQKACTSKVTSELSQCLLQTRHLFSKGEVADPDDLIEVGASGAAPWSSSLAKEYSRGNAPWWRIDWFSVGQFFLPIYGNRKSSEQWNLSAFALVCMTWVFQQRRGPVKVNAAMKAQGGNWWWIDDPGAFHNLDSTLSFFLVLATAFALGDPIPNGDYMYQGLPPHWKWLCVALLGTGACILAGPTLANYRAVRTVPAVLGAAAYVLHSARASQTYPSHDRMPMDWALLLMLVALCLRPFCGEAMVSGWLRKCTLAVLCAMYWNAFWAKLTHTGNPWEWATGDILRSHLDSQRVYSCWPWLTDFICSGPHWMVACLAQFTLFFEGPFTILALFGCGRVGTFTAVRWCWVLSAVALHAGIYVLMFPSFTAEVYVLISLVADPLAYVSQATSTSRVENEQVQGDHRGLDFWMRLALSVSTFAICVTWLYIGFTRCCAETMDPVWPFSTLPMYSQ